MFTGIVETTGYIKGLFRKKDVYRLKILAGQKMGSLREGGSVSVNGICLTLTQIKGKFLFFDVMKETFAGTSLKNSKYNDVVNIERALQWDGRLDGHFVSGHIDGVRKIKTINRHSRPFVDVSIEKGDRPSIVKKGSIAIDGISLTIGDIYEDRFRAYIIPYTLRLTNLKYKKRGSPVNIEFDILGKYAQNKPALQTYAVCKAVGFI